MTTRLVERRQATLRDLIRGNPILAQRVEPFLHPAVAWDDDGDGIVTAKYDSGGVVQILEMEKSMLRLGRADFPERTRIPIGPHQ